MDRTGDVFGVLMIILAALVALVVLVLATRRLVSHRRAARSSR
jgi:uncharacterized membrane protein